MKFIYTLITISVASLFAISCQDSAQDERITLTGSSTVAPVVADAAKAYEASHPKYRIDVQTGGSSRGIADAKSGLADMGMISRALKEEESDLTAHRIAVDGVCVITHNTNPIENLTRTQLIDIYTGKISNWKDVGGPAQEIVVVNKAAGRATLEVFLDYVGLDSADVQADVVAGENQQAIKTVAGNESAIGYVSIGAAASEADAGTAIKLVSCDGVPASTASVASGEFPITRPLQVVTMGEVSPAAAAFLEYLKSSQINDIIESHLYVPISN